MKRCLFRSSVLFLLLASTFIWWWGISIAEASPDVHQGDFILQGNNVTVIEGRFDINGSMIVEENATLILRNALINFTQVEDKQFSMIFQYPANGSPRLIVENATMASDHYLEVKFYGNSSGSISMLKTLGDIRLRGQDFSVVNLSDSSLFGVLGSGESIVSILNCTVMHLWATGNSTVDISDSIVSSYVDPIAHNVNCSITALEPGFFGYWNFIEACQVVLTSPGSAPNLTLIDTEVNSWSLDLYDSSNTTIFDSRLGQLRFSSSVVSIYDSSLSTIIGEYGCALYIHNSTTSRLIADYSTAWFVNSTCSTYNIGNQAEVYVSWHLNIHVLDSEGTDVPSATVTANYPNGTVAASKLTNINGQTKLTLIEKMINNTGTYLTGNYTVAATYETHTDQKSVNMTENKQITITLLFIISESPLFLLLTLFVAATVLIVTLHRRSSDKKEEIDQQLSAL